MNAYVPKIAWAGETIALHLKLIDGALCLFDREGRLLGGVTKVSTTQELEEAVSVTVEVFVEKGPD